MRRYSAKRLVLVVGLAALGCGIQVGSAGAQATMPEGSFVCKPLSAENFLPPPPFRPPGELTPEEREYLEANKLPPDLCPPGMIAYPIPGSVQGMPPGGGGPRERPPEITKPEVDPELSGSKNVKAKAQAKAKAKRAKLRRKKARAQVQAKKRRLAKARAAARR